MRKKSDLHRFAPTGALDSAQRFFMVGIGGAGMSGVARIMKQRGLSVLGTDGASTETTDRLLAEGIEVHIGHSGEWIKPGDAVVLTDAIDLDRSPEVEAALALGCPLLRRSQALAWLLRGRKTICVTGTHGKSTTTGMTAAGLIAAGLDPLVVVGADVPDFGSTSIVMGQGEWAVVEACEAYESYLDFEPAIAVLTNLELDHVDYHGSLENLEASMQAFLSKVPADGVVVVSNDEGARKAAAPLGLPTLEYTETTFSDQTGGLAVRLKGDKSRLNAGGALLACMSAGADPALAAQGISGFGGVERRLQVLQREPVAVVDDYAHMPAEIEASIRAMREEFPGRRIVAVFQPHLYTRTAANIAGFAIALSLADEVLVTDIYPAREDPMPGVSSLLIAEAITEVPHEYIPSKHLLPRAAARIARPGDVVMGMGAGDISRFAPALLEELKRPSRGAVAVLYGGESAEREVAIHSGLAVKKALERRGYATVLIDPTERLLTGKGFPEFCGPSRPSCALLLTHGKGGEDGALQGLMQLMHMPYSGPGVYASSLALDKEATKRVLANAGIRVPQGVLVRRGDAAPELPFDRAVIKPNRQGSTAGLTFARSREEFAPGIERALKYDDACLVEEWIEGVEISCPVFGGRALLPVEIRPKDGAYDFANKYTPGATDEPCPPPSLSADQIRRAQELALASHLALGCTGITRTDMIVSPDEVVVLETNTLPGMTPTSLVPISAKADGMSFEDVVEWMVQDAIAQGER